MVKLDFGISLEGIDIKKELESYARSGFRWHKTGSPDGKHVVMKYEESILTQYLITEYLESTKLEFGNKRHIEMLQAGTLMAILFNCNNVIYWDSNYFNLMDKADEISHIVLY
ncbi:MAG TPA: hypothetical protein VJA86_00155 [Candidatus Nanoarchaeia archaeon]|nr:hypothetical protein [Candidatus Nanoarchaeia archaeon]